MSCRWGHSSGLINQKAMFVFGGIDPNGYALRSVMAYNYVDNEVIPLTEKGTPMPTRLGCGILAIGNGMFLLYGGEDPQGRGSFSDLWHIRVHLGSKDVHYTEAKYKDAHEHFILSWRQGFSVHFVKSQ
jgi:hypothetical protein